MTNVAVDTSAHQFGVSLGIVGNQLYFILIKDLVESYWTHYAAEGTAASYQDKHRDQQKGYTYPQRNYEYQVERGSRIGTHCPQTDSRCNIVEIAIVKRKVLPACQPGQFVSESSHNDVLNPEEQIQQNVCEIVRGEIGSGDHRWIRQERKGEEEVVQEDYHGDQEESVLCNYENQYGGPMTAVKLEMIVVFTHKYNYSRIIRF